MVDYADVPLSPYAVARGVSFSQYTGSEYSEALSSPLCAERVEAKRREMTVQERAEFATLCDERCQAAHAAKSQWWIKCITARGNSGRDRLWRICAHWLAAYLLDRDAFCQVTSGS